jgi:uncharacterized membrane protein
MTQAGVDEPRRRGRPGWLLPAGLIALSAIPIIAGASRIAQLNTGVPVTPANARFVAMPVPVELHIIFASLYLILGAFQFAPRFRRRRPGWHRIAGRLLVPSGLIAASAGMWMTLFYPHVAGDGAPLKVFRLVFGSAMILSIVLGLAAILRRDIARHRVWMIRGYAIGLGTGTQVLTTLPWILLLGQPGVVPRELLLLAGWVINLAVVEWFIRRRPIGSTRASAGQASQSGPNAGVLVAR